MGVDAVGGPFGHGLQRVGVAHADQAGTGFHIGFGGVEVLAVGAGEHVAIERSVPLLPQPLRFGGVAGPPAHQPVAGAAGGGQHRAVGQHTKAVGAGGDVERCLHLQCVGAAIARVQQADVVAALVLPRGGEGDAVVALALAFAVAGLARAAVVRCVRPVRACVRACQGRVGHAGPRAQACQHGQGVASAALYRGGMARLRAQCFSLHRHPRIQC